MLPFFLTIDYYIILDYLYSKVSVMASSFGVRLRGRGYYYMKNNLSLKEKVLKVLNHEEPDSVSD